MKVSGIVLIVAILAQFGLGNAQANDTLTLAGDVIQIALPATVLIYSLYNDKEGLKQFALSFSVMEIVTYGLKYAVGEKRPNGGDNLSFPSAHTAAAFSAAADIQKRYGWKYGGFLAYSLATFVGLSRLDEHHWWDIVAGAAIGIGINEIFVKNIKNMAVVPVVPVSSGKSVGIGLMAFFYF